MNKRFGGMMEQGRRIPRMLEEMLGTDPPGTQRMLDAAGGV